MTTSTPSPLASPHSNQLLYAVPVSLDSFARGFAVHQHWAPRFWAPRRQAFRESIYHVLDRDAPQRRIESRLPEEIIRNIEQYVREDGFQKVRRKWERNARGLESSMEEIVRISLGGLEREGRGEDGLMGVNGGRIEDPIKKYMMTKFSLVILPGMFTTQFYGKRLLYIYLCAFSNEIPVQDQEGNREIREPELFPHLGLTEVQTRGVASSKKTVWTRTKPKFGRRIEVLDSEFVSAALDGQSKIGMAVRELDLEVLVFRNGG